ncbi:MAG: hypothetical protein ABFS38_06160 [Bacteroidota bacterium]
MNHVDLDPQSIDYLVNHGFTRVCTGFPGHYSSVVGKYSNRKIVYSNKDRDSDNLPGFFKHDEKVRALREQFYPTIEKNIESGDACKASEVVRGAFTL